MTQSSFLALAFIVITAILIYVSVRRGPAEDGDREEKADGLMRSKLEMGGGGGEGEGGGEGGGEHDPDAAVEREVVSLEEYERQALALEAAGQLAGRIAHNLNNLLMGIMGHCEMLISRTRRGSPAHRDLEEIKKKILHAGDLTRRLQALSRRHGAAPARRDPPTVAKPLPDRNL